MYTFGGRQPIEDLTVVEAGDGIFYPARYPLADDTVLLSYWLGHTGWLRAGDRIFGPPLPLLVRDNVRYRAVLRYEALTMHRLEDRR